MNAPQGKFPDKSPDPGRWLDDHGDYLFKYAVFRLRDNNAAEDAVQETFLAALKAYKEFEGRASERTWLVGILKHKIVDHFNLTKVLSTASFLRDLNHGKAIGTPIMRQMNGMQRRRS
jgi:DNA-directed RNA polymerase specialized sigma24 family protein